MGIVYREIISWNSFNVFEPSVTSLCTLFQLKYILKRTVRHKNPEYLSCKDFIFTKRVFLIFLSQLRLFCCFRKLLTAKNNKMDVDKFKYRLKKSGKNREIKLVQKTSPLTSLKSHFQMVSTNLRYLKRNIYGLITPGLIRENLP